MDFVYENSVYVYIYGGYGIHTYLFSIWLFKYGIYGFGRGGYCNNESVNMKVEDNLCPQP